MTVVGDKLRGVVLAALLVASALVGVSSVSGVAAAAGNDVAITTATEADGTVEVVFDAAATSDPPEQSDVDVYLDGVRVVDDGTSDRAAGGQSWTLGDFSESGSNATFVLQTDGTRQDVDPNRNLTVEFEGVARPGATNTDPEAEVTVSGAVASEEGFADTRSGAQRIYQGSPVALRANETNAEVFLQNADTSSVVFVGRTGEDSTTLVFQTSSLNTGADYEVEFGSSPTVSQWFTVRDLDFSATAVDTDIDDETPLRVNVSAVRGGGPLTARLVDDGGDVVETVTTTLPGDAETTLSFGPQTAGEGPYTARVVDNATNATATTAPVSVSATGSPGDGSVGFLDSEEDTADDADPDRQTFTDPAELRTTVAVAGTRAVYAERVPLTTTDGEATASFTDDAPVASVALAADVEGRATAVTLGSRPVALDAIPGQPVTLFRVTVPDGAADTPGTVRARAPAALLTATGAAAEDLRLHRYVAGEWEPLDTSVTEQSDDGVTLAADVPGFSFFAVSATGTPTARADLPTTVAPGEPVVLDASGSDTPYGNVTDYEWSLAGRRVSGETATVTLEEPGTYTATLTVTNDAGASATDTAEVRVEATEPTATTGTTEPVPTATRATTSSATAEPTAVTTTDGAGPGFGPLLALAALFATLLVRRRVA